LTGGPPSERRRRALLAVVSSDVTRRRGWLAAAAAGAVAAFLVLLLRDGARSLGAPGPLSRPHAALACASCHDGSRAAAGSGCASCHGAHPSTRTAHRRLADSGTLGCATCHAVHRSEDGLAFDSNGAVSLYGSGFERVLVAPLVSQPKRGEVAEVLVPLVRRAACAGCHDASNDRDPAAHCMAGDSAFSLCFDEHRLPAQASGREPALRDAAIERARVLARGAGASPGALASFGSDAAVVTVALGVAGLSLVLDRRKRRVAPRSVAPMKPPPGTRRLPVIDAASCLGCEACVDACPYDALVVKRYVAVLARPDACCGAGPCQESCPNGSLTLVADGAATPGPRLSEALESLDRPGIFLAGDVTGSSLVRNALRQGVEVAHAVAARVANVRAGARSDASGLDVVIVGAGPAGLAAALTAQSLGLACVVLEQGRLADSIQSFSRQKLVLDAPLAADEKLPLFIGDVHKEELVQRWQRTVRAARLSVREGARVLEVVASDQGFRVRALLPGGAPFEAAATAVVLAIGTRGTARALAATVDEAARPHVHYELSDARSFAGRTVVVVGLGDVAMESALALAAQPGTSVTVLARGAAFRRGRQRNIDALSALAAEGRVRLVFEAEVARVRPRVVEAEVAGVDRAFPCDAVFVHVGRVPSHELLARAGPNLPSESRSLPARSGEAT
jgi:thioredoxin reductase/ferredoxin